MHSFLSRTTAVLKRLFFVTLGLAAVTLAHWFALETHRLVLQEDVRWRVLLFSAAGAITLGFAVTRLFHERPVIAEIVTSRAADGLILFLSTPLRSYLSKAPGPSPQGVLEESPEWRDLRKRLADLAAAPARLQDVPCGDLAGLFGSSSWLMPVLSIRHQLSVRPHPELHASKVRLKQVLVIGSADSRNGNVGTFHVAQDFASYMISLAKDPLVKIDVLPRAIDFNDFHVLDGAVDEAFRHLRSQGCKAILIDVTGGTKECSVAAAVRALVADRRFKYVHYSASENELRDLQYDIRYEIAKAHLPE